MQDTNTISVLENLFETVENGRLGFAEAAQILDDHGDIDLAAEMRELSQQRLRIANELRDLAAAEGATLGDQGEGTVAGSIHRGWMALKDAVSGDGPHAVLAAAEQGEDHAVAEYEQAIQEDLPPSILPIVERQAGEVRSAHDRVRLLRDQTE